VATVYILRSGDEDVFKIGRTHQPVPQRRGQLSTGNPHRLTVFDSIETSRPSECETFLHRRLQTRRLRDGGGREFYAIAADELADLIREARAFVAGVVPTLEEAERLAKAQSEDLLLQPGTADRVACERLLKVREAEARLKLERECLEAQLKLVIGKAAGLDGLATWRTETFETFDESAFRCAHPKLHAAFVRESHRRPFRLL
jgi:hypothetical protein